MLAPATRQAPAEEYTATAFLFSIHGIAEPRADKTPFSPISHWTDGLVDNTQHTIITRGGKRQARPLNVSIVTTRSQTAAKQNDTSQQQAAPAVIEAGKVDLKELQRKHGLTRKLIDYFEKGCTLSAKIGLGVRQKAVNFALKDGILCRRVAERPRDPDPTKREAYLPGDPTSAS